MLRRRTAVVLNAMKTEFACLPPMRRDAIEVPNEYNVE